MTYFDELTERLRSGGVPEEQVTATIDELAGHLAETGADPEAEFGPVDEFAAQLAESRGDAAQPDPTATTWRWIADAFVELDHLATFGAQGWEVTHVDRTGHFVSRRDPERPQRWEYRREVTLRNQAGVVERLSPDGWELCGAWGPFHYFKRPVAASIGPAAELSTPPEMPQRSNFLSKKFWLFCGALFAGLLVLQVPAVLINGSFAVLLTIPIGMVVGGALGVGISWATQRKARGTDL
ncbi:DUF2812 domain-containing protein [Saccharopolyspora sp. K220]|uniref:DUF2812 domain-containing protein n=1 Tax=Saccharopolyspora soli TaxID=2926618 RepID=UPI001F5875BF|nr:DUF2812 domain-containing protein [Saccharopolyspora soli]MCI2419442.1 DUF2812 domain-containing protein [Saccharopolyspora soli]